MGIQLPPPKKIRGTIFGPCLLWPNGHPSQLLSTCNVFFLTHSMHNFTAQRYASAVYAMDVSVRLSVHLSVHPSQVGVLSKRLNRASWKQAETTRHSSFLTPKILLKFQSSHPNGTPNARGAGKICDFLQITRCIWKTAQDRYIISMKK